MIIKDEDLPVAMQDRQRLAHKIAKQACMQVWNIASDASNKISKQISGLEALSYMGTLLQDFVGRWIVMMDKIRERDDAGVLQEDMIKEVLNGILATIGATATLEEEQELPNGIKRLKKAPSRE